MFLSPIFHLSFLDFLHFPAVIGWLWFVLVEPVEILFFSFGNTIPKLSPHPLIPTSSLFSHRQGYYSHCMHYLCWCGCVCVCMFFLMLVILSFYACVLLHLVFLFAIVVIMEAAELELGRFVWCTVCKQILQRMTLYWPSTVCFCGACGFKISSSNYIHWIHLKSAMVVLIISNNIIPWKQMMAKAKMFVRESVIDSMLPSGTQMPKCFGLFVVSYYNESCICYLAIAFLYPSQIKTICFANILKACFRLHQF